MYHKVKGRRTQLDCITKSRIVSFTHLKDQDPLGYDAGKICFQKIYIYTYLLHVNRIGSIFGCVASTQVIYIMCVFLYLYPEAALTVDLLA